MSHPAVDPRGYLQARFRTDADTLRERVAALAAGAVRPGPDAATSRAMAAACDAVVALMDTVPGGDPASTLAALQALRPALQARAQEHAAQPAVRAVFAGAITRVNELAAGAHA